MKRLPSVDMFELTRLTREGRLGEAMAMLRGAGPDASGTPQPDSREIELSPPGQGEAAWAFAQAAGPGTAPANAGGEGPFARNVRTWMDRLSSADFGALQPAPAAVAEPGAGRFEARTFTGEAGSRDYKLYVPASFSGAALPLIVMLHGCTQSPDDFAAGTRMNEVAEELGLLVAYPAQSKSANSSKCWNWFNGADQKRGRGEPSLIAGITREIMAEFPVRDGQVFVAGLSAGGAAAAVMGETYPDLFAAIGVHSGLACGAARDMASAFGAMREGGAGTVSARSGPILPTIVFHGDRDSTVHPLNADQVIAQAKADARLQTTVVKGAAPGGMPFTKSVALDEAGRPLLEQWTLHGAGHAWSGGSTAGTYTDPNGPDASREMARFFLQLPPRA